MTEMQRHADLQSEVRSTQHVLVALLQERLETETHLKAARAELEKVRRGIEVARSEQTRQVAEFDSVVQGAIAEGRTLAAEIEALVRRRDAEHTPREPLSTTPSAAPTALPIELIPTSPPVPPAAVIPPAPITAPAQSSVPRSATELISPARSIVRQYSPELATPAESSVPQHGPEPVGPAAPSDPHAPQAITSAVSRTPQPATEVVRRAVASVPLRVLPLAAAAAASALQRAPRLSMPQVPMAEPAQLSVSLRSIREQVTAFSEQGTARRYTAVLGRVRLHRPGLRQTANLFIGSILALLAILLTPVSQVVGGLQLLAVMSGSMEPTIQVGGAVGVRPVAATDLKVGDVITFATQANPDVLVTHRIVSLETRDGQMMVTTKGDANNTIDAMAAPADHAVGRVDFALPFLGYLMVWLASPVAKILILVVTVVSFALPTVKRAPEPAAAGLASASPTSPATSYTALEDEIQALLSPQP